MFPKPIAIFFFLSVLLGPAYAVELSNPHLAEQLNVDFRQFGTVSISEGDIAYIALNISTFQNNENQKAKFFGAMDFAADEFGNKKLRLMQKAKSREFSYDVSGTAEIFAKHTLALPASYTVSEKEKIFLLPTKNIQSDDPEIAGLARNITRGAGTDFEKAARIAIWINANVNYTLDLGEEAKDAKWVLEHRIGTCDEFTTLFIAMARSLGIPAKYISGYVYGSLGWQKHAWAEVYLGKWVPVDATWLEVGNIDATHIKFMETADNYIANQATALGTELGTITWVSDNATITAEGLREIEPAQYELISSAGRFEGSGGNQNIMGLGKSALIGMRITPKEYSADKFALLSCKGIDIIRIEDPKQSAILEPGKEKIIFWTISSNGNLERDSVYTCPLALNSRFFGKKTIEITVDPRVKDSLELDAALDKYAAQVNENLAITVYLKNPGSRGTARIGFVSEDAAGEKEVDLDNGGGGTVEFAFPAGSEGKHAVYIYSDRGDVLRQEYQVYETGDVFIERVNAPDFVRLNEKAFLEVYVRNNKHSAANAKFAAKLNDALLLDETSSIPPQSSRLINITIPSESAGAKRFSMRLVSDSVEEKIREVRVYGVPQLEFEGAYDSGPKAAILKIIPKNDGAENIEAAIGAEAARIGKIEMNESAELKFSLPKGAYDVVVAYSDAAGNRYEARERIEFREKGILDFLSAVYLWLAGLF